MQQPSIALENYACSRRMPPCRLLPPLPRPHPLPLPAPLRSARRSLVAQENSSARTAHLTSPHGVAAVGLAAPASAVAAAPAAAAMPAWLDRMKSAVGLAEEEEQAEAGLLQQLDEATSEWSRAGPTVDACSLQLLSPGVAACSSKLRSNGQPNRGWLAFWPRQDHCQHAEC